MLVASLQPEQALKHFQILYSCPIVHLKGKWLGHVSDSRIRRFLPSALTPQPVQGQGQCLLANSCAWACWWEVVPWLVLGTWQPEEWSNGAMSWSKCLQNWCRYVAQQSNTVFAPPYKLWVTEPFRLLFLAFWAIHQIRNLGMVRFVPREENCK